MEKIVVPVDGSEESMDALRYAFGLFPTATIEIVHIIEVDSFPDSKNAVELAAERADEVLSQAESVAAEANRDIETVRLRGHAAKAIATYAEENDADHIVLGSTGRTGLKRVLFGSVAESVTRRASVPVTIVR